MADKEDNGVDRSNEEGSHNIELHELYFVVYILVGLYFCFYVKQQCMT